MKIKTEQEVMQSKNKVGLHCIYFLISNSQIVYVGQSKNGGFDRIGAHLKYSDKQFDSYFIQACGEDEINEVEAEYILKFTPFTTNRFPRIKNLPPCIPYLKSMGIGMLKNLSLF